MGKKEEKKLPANVARLLEVHYNLLAMMNEKVSVDYKYNEETGELQFMTRFMFEPEITTEKPIDYQEK